MKGTTASRRDLRDNTGQSGETLKLGRMRPNPSRVSPARSYHEAVYVRYRDHVLFKNCLSKTVKSAVREAVGWIARQDETAVCLVCDRSLNKTLLERESVESGLVILRSDILELRQIC